MDTVETLRKEIDILKQDQRTLEHAISNLCDAMEAIQVHIFQEEVPEELDS